MSAVLFAGRERLEPDGDGLVSLPPGHAHVLAVVIGGQLEARVHSAPLLVTGGVDAETVTFGVAGRERPGAVARSGADRDGARRRGENERAGQVPAAGGGARRRADAPVGARHAARAHDPDPRARGQAVGCVLTFAPDPILTIEVAAHGAVRFRWADDTVLDLDGTIDYDRDSFERTLASCRRTLGSLVSSVEATAAAVRGADDGSRADDDRPRRLQCQQARRDRAPVRCRPAPHDGDHRPSRRGRSARGSRLLPLRADAAVPAGAGRWESYADIEQHLARFLGYSFVIRHVPRVSVTSAPLERASSTGSLPVQFVHFESTGAIKELEQLTAHPVGLAIDGPWPAPNATRTAVIESLTSAIHDPSRSLLGDRGEICRVKHFALPLQHASAAEARRTSSSCSVRRVTSSRLRQGDPRRHTRAGTDTGARVARPLVFLNRCGSARSRMTDPLLPGSSS